jgi:hypothetical protein
MPGRIYIEARQSRPVSPSNSAELSGNLCPAPQRWRHGIVSAADGAQGTDPWRSKSNSCASKLKKPRAAADSEVSEELQALARAFQSQADVLKSIPKARLKIHAASVKLTFRPSTRRPATVRSCSKEPVIFQIRAGSELGQAPVACRILRSLNPLGASRPRDIALTIRFDKRRRHVMGYALRPQRCEDREAPTLAR